MSREIRFREWDSLEKKMDYNPSRSINLGYDMGGDAVLKIYLNGWINDCDGCRPTRFYEQSTGLLDCNGKEIYEGDIVRYSFINPNQTYTELVSFGPIDDGEGYYHQEFLAWRTNWADDGTAHSSLLDLVEPNWTCEIIGNIHENPELLDKNDKV